MARQFLLLEILQIGRNAKVRVDQMRRAITGFGDEAGNLSVAAIVAELRGLAKADTKNVQARPRNAEVSVGNPALPRGDYQAQLLSQFFATAAATFATVVQRNPRYVLTPLCANSIPGTYALPAGGVAAGECANNETGALSIR